MAHQACDTLAADARAFVAQLSADVGAAVVPLGGEVDRCQRKSNLDTPARRVGTSNLIHRSVGLLPLVRTLRRTFVAQRGREYACLALVAKSIALALDRHDVAWCSSRSSIAAVSTASPAKA